MARIAGVDIPENKRVEVALTYIKGVGRGLSRQILQEVEISPDMKVRDLSEKDISRIREVIEKREYRVEGELSQEVALNIKRLKDVRSYRGIRHERGLPARGQQTRTNARTRRGKKISAVGGTSRSARKAKAAEKT